MLLSYTKLVGKEKYRFAVDIFLSLQTFSWLWYKGYFSKWSQARSTMPVNTISEDVFTMIHLSSKWHVYIHEVLDQAVCVTKHDVNGIPFRERTLCSCIRELVSLHFIRAVSAAPWLHSGSPALRHQLNFLKPVGFSHHLKVLFFRQNSLLYPLTHRSISSILILSPLTMFYENSSKYLTWKCTQFMYLFSHLKVK